MLAQGQSFKGFTVAIRANKHFFLQVSQSGYANLINRHNFLQSPAGKWPNNELLKTCRFVFYEQGGRYPDWLTC